MPESTSTATSLTQDRVVPTAHPVKAVKTVSRWLKLQCDRARANIRAPGCIPNSECTDGENWIAATCPTVYHIDPETPASGNADSTRYRFSVKNRDDFNKKMSDDYGIPGEWIKFGNWRYYLQNGCQFGDGSDDCYLYYNGFPSKSPPSAAFSLVFCGFYQSCYSNLCHPKPASIC